MVFSLHLVYLSTAACIFEKNKFGSMLAQGFLRVKGQAQITEWYFLWVDAINKHSLTSHYLMRQQAPMVFSLHSRIFKDQRSSKNHKMLLFVSWRNKYAIIEWPLFDAPTSTHGVFTFFSLFRYCCLHFCENKFGLILVQGYFTGQRSSIIHKLQLFMTLCDTQLLSGHYLMRNQVPMVSLLL